MGLRECDKSDCNNIMCDRCSDLGYICNECFDGLVKEFSSKYSSCESYEFWDKVFPRL